MKNIIMFVIKLLALVVWAGAHLVPRNKNIWLFGEPNGFNNNSKYLFLDIIESHPNIKAIWISSDKILAKELRDHGLNARYKWSIKGIVYCLIAKVYVVSWTQGDISFYLSGGAIIVNLWHGVGAKKCLWLLPENIVYENAKLFSKSYHLVNNPALYFPPNLVLSTSPFYTENVFVKFFRIRREDCVEDIYPRVKFMLKSRQEILDVLEKYSFVRQLQFNVSLAKYRRVFLYAPTYRDNKQDFVTHSGIDFMAINERMISTKSLFIVKFHPATIYDNAKYATLSNVRFLDVKDDLYSIMPYTDVLITDYSSILADYLLLHKKIIAFLFDFDSYKKNCRELQFDFLSTIEGIPIAWNSNELLSLLYTDLPDIPRDLIQRYWQPSESLVERIFHLEGL